MKNFNLRTLVNIFLISVTILGLAWYSYVKASPLLEGPIIEITSPIFPYNDIDRVISVTGNAYRANHLSINGLELILGEDGEFTHQVVLHNGYNLVRIEATDRFNKTKVKDIDIYYQPKQNFITPQ